MAKYQPAFSVPQRYRGLKILSDAAEANSVNLGTPVILISGISTALKNKFVDA